MSTSVRFRVDGFNLYHAIREARRQGGIDCRWLDIRSLCESLLHSIGNGAHIAEPEGARPAALSKRHETVPR